MDFITHLAYSFPTTAVNRGVHGSFENLSDTYPIQNRKVFDRLQALCSQLAHWAPILAEVSACINFCSLLVMFMVYLCDGFMLR